MSGDTELDQLKAGVNCAAVLERLGNGYKLDQRESSRAHLKYRRGEGEIIIVSHGGRGWWDPGSSAKGDVIGLVQFLDPSLNLGQVRRTLRQMVGISPSFTPAERRRKDAPRQPPSERWRARPRLTEGSPSWAYLTEERRLPAEVLLAAARADAVREGPYASAWFAHRDGEGVLTGFEARGPNYRGFSEDGLKTLFRLQPGAEPPMRLAVAEAPIDAMSLAALEGMRRDTLYVSTTGGMGPGTIAELERELVVLATRSGVLAIATDADVQGQKYAARLTEMATAAGVQTERAAPSGGHNDWNDMLKAARQPAAPPSYPQFSPALAAIARAMDRPPPVERQPWEPASIRMIARVRAFEERQARETAEAMATRNRAEPRPAPPRPQGPSPAPGVQP